MTERMTGGMKDFAALLETLVLTPSRNAKITAMAAYFRAPRPIRIAASRWRPSRVISASPISRQARCGN